MERFIRRQNVERYRRLSRVIEQSDQQKILNLLAEEHKMRASGPNCVHGRTSFGKILFGGLKRAALCGG